MIDLDRAALERLRDAVAARLGLQLDDAKLEDLAEVAALRMEATGDRTLAGYAARVASPSEREEPRALAERLTVGETYFFRNANDLRAFVEVVVPARLAARGPARALRILSAGCSSGEEPYTIAMLLRDDPRLAGAELSIVGLDVNRAALARAAAARYSPWSLRQTSAEARARFFEADGRDLRLDPSVRAMVTLEERNLVEEDPRFWAPGAFDVVFCRNVLMYLAPEVVRRVVARIAGALAPGGFLFLGHAETLRGVSAGFHLRHTHDTFYYQRRDAEPGAEGAAAAGGDADWYEAIGRASDRIAALAAAPAPGPLLAPPLLAPPLLAPPLLAPAPAAGSLAADPGGPVRLARALELLAQDRHAAALEALGSTPPELETDEDALLLRAVLLASSGECAAAERVCARILTLDELNAEAHYVNALCREHAGDRAAAADHDRYALYLDPSFAMPRLHLGLLARRAGDPEAARRELARALVLLAAEEGSRVLLLGGGFGREALLELCRSELRACGGLA